MIELRNVSKTYISSHGEVAALSNVSLKVNAAEFVAITGSSGSGKSTLLSIIGCLDKPTSGQYLFENTPLNIVDDKWLAKFRNHKIGFVFQQFNLIPRFNALENVELPLVYSDVPKKVRQHKAKLALQAVGLADRITHRPSELSGGQQQRVAIARSLINNPSIILADEPTGSLDKKSSHEVMSLFKQLHEVGKTIIFITHDNNLLSFATRVLSMSDGRLVR